MLRTRTPIALVIASMLFVAARADAFATVTMTARGPVSSLATSDTVTVDVFLDVGSGLTLFSVGVLSSSDAVLAYDPIASAATPPFMGAGPGAQPSYILYIGGKPASILYPVPTPAFANWPAPPPGQEQVNINFAEPLLNPNPVSGSGLWIATLVFEVTGPLMLETLSLSVTAGGNLVQTGSTVLPPSATTLSAPIQLVPEPNSTMLVAVGVAGLGALGLLRRRLRDGSHSAS
jgi:hypothetical protein